MNVFHSRMCLTFPLCLLFSWCTHIYEMRCSGGSRTVCSDVRTYILRTMTAESNCRDEHFSGYFVLALLEERSRSPSSFPPFSLSPPSLPSSSEASTISRATAICFQHISTNTREFNADKSTDKMGTTLHTLPSLPSSLRL